MISAVGGVWPALTAAVVGFLLVNWYFTPPVHTFTVEEGENLLALSVFLAVAAVVSGFVSLAARRAADGARARAEAEALAGLAGAAPCPFSLDGLRRILALDAVAVFHRTDAGWTLDHATGAPVPETPSGRQVELDDIHVLTIVGRAVESEADNRILDAFAREITSSLALEELTAEASEAGTLAAAGDLRTAILSAVSHDLRTPLSGIKASVTSLLQEDVEWTPEARHEFLLTIDEESDRLNDLVGNLLDMSRLQTGALDVSLSAVGVDEVIPAALASIGARAAEVDVDVDETHPRVLADPGLLERALANVIVNALNHSPPGERVRVVAGAAGDAVDVRVVDRGPGVPPGDRETVFLPFQRLGDTGGGDGVGTRPRGRERVRGGDRRGRGDRGHPGRRADDGVPPQGGAVTRILVVDDEPQLLRALGTNLKARDYEVDLAPTGELALTLAARNHPDLVVLDLGLPGIDGIEVIQGLRGWTQVPIIVLSVREGERDKVAALDAGADDYVTKPFGMDELLARLRAALRRAAPADETAAVVTPDFTVDLAAKRVTNAAGDVRLTPTEWEIVEILVRNPGKLITQRQLLHEVWGPQYSTETNYLRVYMAQIRRKLEPDPSRPRSFHTEARMGYRFDPPERDDHARSCDSEPP